MPDANCFNCQYTCTVDCFPGEKFKKTLSKILIVLHKWHGRKFKRVRNVLSSYSDHFFVKAYLQHFKITSLLFLDTISYKGIGTIRPYKASSSDTLKSHPIWEAITLKFFLLQYTPKQEAILKWVVVNLKSKFKFDYRFEKLYFECSMNTNTCRWYSQIIRRP